MKNFEGMKFWQLFAKTFLCAKNFLEHSRESSIFAENLFKKNCENFRENGFDWNFQCEILTRSLTQYDLGF